MATFIDRSEGAARGGAGTAPALAEGGGGGDPPPTGDSKTATSTESVVTAQKRYHLVALILIVVGTYFGAIILDGQHNGAGLPQLAQGVSIFAALYILAQTIERLIEPVSPLLGGILGSSASLAPQTKGAIKKARDQALVTAKMSPDASNAQTAADKQAALAQYRANATAMAMGVATLLATLAAGYFGFLLLRLIGLTSVPGWIDVLVTGLAVGGGTKPLHDLISNIKESKTAKQDPPEVSA